MREREDNMINRHNNAAVKLPAVERPRVIHSPPQPAVGSLYRKPSVPLPPINNSPLMTQQGQYEEISPDRPSHGMEELSHASSMEDKRDIYSPRRQFNPLHRTTYTQTITPRGVKDLSVPKLDLYSGRDSRYSNRCEASISPYSLSCSRTETRTESDLPSEASTARDDEEEEAVWQEYEKQVNFTTTLACDIQQYEVDTKQQNGVLDEIMLKNRHLVEEELKITGQMIKTRETHRRYKEETANQRVLHKTDLLSSSILEEENGSKQEEVLRLHQEIMDIKERKTSTEQEFKQSINHLKRGLAQVNVFNRNLDMDIEQAMERYEALLTKYPDSKECDSHSDQPAAVPNPAHVRALEARTKAISTKKSSSIPDFVKDELALPSVKHQKRCQNITCGKFVPRPPQSPRPSKPQSRRVSKVKPAVLPPVTRKPPQPPKPEKNVVKVSKGGVRMDFF